MHRYDQEIAKHYAAYRPPVHELILREALQGRKFGTGLDVGSGTGRSSNALLSYCSNVVALDNSDDMLQMASQNSNISYRLADGARWPVDGNSIDVVTLAGVLPYLNERDALDEVRRVCRPDVLIVPYDFEVRTNTLMNALSVNFQSTTSGYDHSKNLSGNKFVSTSVVETNTIEIAARPEEAAHVLLSDVDTHTSLGEALGATDLFRKTTAKLGESAWCRTLEVKTYYAVHELFDQTKNQQ